MNLIYELFSRFKAVFFILIMVIFGVAGYFASQLKLEEDIARMMPTDEKVHQLNQVFQNSKFMDKLVITVSLEDDESGTDELITYASELIDSVKAQLVPNYISEVSDRFEDNLINKVYDTFYEHLPLFLEEGDYLKLDTMIREERIVETLERNYKTLVSPISMLMKKFIVKDPLSITPMALRKLESLQLDDNYELYDGYVVTKDHKHLMLFLSSTYPNNETSKNAEMLSMLESIISKNNQKFRGKARAEYFGAVAVAVGNARQIKEDIKLTVSIALILLLLLIGFFFRKLSVFVIMLLPVAFGGLLGIAVLYLTKGAVSAVALGVGSVLLGITIDFSLHTITHFKSVAEPKKVLKDIAAPIMMSCVTTSSAFLCLFFVRAEALKELGLFAAVSVFCAALFCLIVMPHLINLKKWKQEKEAVKSIPLFERITAYQFHKSKGLIFSIFLVSLVWLFTYDKVSVEDDMMNMNYMSSELKTAEDNLNKINNYSLKSVYLVASGNSLDEALNNNEKALGQLRELKENGVVDNYSTPSDLLISKQLQQQKIDRWNNFWTDDKINKVKENLLKHGEKYSFKLKAFKQFFALLDKDFTVVDISAFSEIRESFLNDFISERDGKVTVTSQLKVAEQNKPNVYATFDNIDGVLVLDRKYVTEKFISILQEDFGLLVKVSLVVVFLILLFAYGRIELTLITMVPMALSWFWTLGIMGALDIKFNIFNIIISTFIFGLGIDYSIFITRGLIQEYRSGEQTLHSYKTSILLSSLTTIIGIGVLIFAEHPALKSIATMSIIGILSVVLISFTVQPMLFRWLISSRKERGNVPMTFSNLINSIMIFMIFLIGALGMTVLGLIFLFPPYGKKLKRKYFYHTMLMYICKAVIYIPVNVRKRIINEHKETFDKPAVIIANHQSHIDIPLILMMHPKIVVLVNDWVYNNPYYGVIVKLADFYPVSMGFEGGLDKLKGMVAEGYSVLVYPEGSRQADCKIQRFHKGAFLLAQELQLDIVPVIIHGAGHVMTKGDNHLKSGSVALKILPRIDKDDQSYGQTGRKKAKEIGAYFKSEYEKLQREIEVPKYFRRELLKNYLYKNPVTEWYVKVKTAIEDNYTYLESIIPKEGVITDIGCGYGYFPYMLHYTSDRRQILGVDYDEDKIEYAQGCPAKRDNINFIAGDALKLDLPDSDVFIMLDILHYLPKELQIQLIEKCIGKLKEGGKLIIRDADTTLEKRAKGTKTTEVFSTKIFGFNKTEHELEFVSRDLILDVAKKHHKQVEIQDHTQLTANITFIIS